MQEITITNEDELRDFLNLLPPRAQMQFLDLLFSPLPQQQEEDEIENDMNLATYHLPLFPQEQRTDSFKTLFSTIFKGNSHICRDMPRPLACDTCLKKYIDNTEELLNTTNNHVYQTILDRLNEVNDNIAMINEHNRVSKEQINLDVVYDLLGINMDHYDPPSKEALAQCQTFHYHKGEEEMTCTICLCDLENDDEVIQLPCHHQFHNQCLSQWIKNNCTCPICKFILK
jgi:hypothetical protein